MDFGRTPEEIENERKRLLIYSLITLGGSFLLFFGFISILQDRLSIALVLFTFLMSTLFIASRASKSGKLHSLGIFVSISLFVLATYLLVSGGAEGTGPYWTYPVVSLMVLIAGPRVGTVFVFVYLIVNAIFLFGDYEFVYPYPYIESFRILATTMALFTLLLASEWIRLGSYGAIVEAVEQQMHLASTDALTKLLNRNGFTGALEERELEGRAVVVIIDIDHFKMVNDRYGHAAGDKVLKALADIIRENTKGGDLCARWGGEEFLIVLFDSSVASAKALTGKIKNQFGEQKFKAREEIFNVTLSGGIANLQSKDEFEQTVKSADELLYEAKDAGRNLILAEET